MELIGHRVATGNGWAGIVVAEDVRARRVHVLWYAGFSSWVGVGEVRDLGEPLTWTWGAWSIRRRPYYRGAQRWGWRWVVTLPNMFRGLPVTEVRESWDAALAVLTDMQDHPAAAAQRRLRP